MPRRTAGSIVCGVAYLMGVLVGWLIFGVFGAEPSDPLAYCTAENVAAAERVVNFLDGERLNLLYLSATGRGDPAWTGPLAGEYDAASGLIVEFMRPCAGSIRP